jgi:DNA-binding NtrC family response regulator
MASRLRIIITEDEWVVRITFAEYLTDAGFEVIEAATAEEVLVILESAAPTINVLITDVRLSGTLDGLALANHAALHWPWIKLLVVSAEAPSRLAFAPVNCGVLRKPVNPEQVVAKVQALTASQE